MLQHKNQKWVWRIKKTVCSDDALQMDLNFPEAASLRYK